MITQDQALVGLVERFLSQKRSRNTRRAYRKDLAAFFGGEPSGDDLAAFFILPYSQAVALVLDYKAQMIERLAPATVNRRLAALRALVDLAHTLGICAWRLEGKALAGEKVESYRDTSGLSVGQVKALLDVPDRSTRKGKRDYAILLLMWENALRRAEVVSLDVADFEPGEARVWIKGKGQAQKSAVDLSPRAVEALNDYLSVRPAAPPMFINEDRARKGDGRLTVDGLYALIRHLAKEAGIAKAMSPHRMRHTAITAALDATAGNVRAVQKLSRHAKIDTLLVYDDARQKQQKAVSELLSSIA